MWLASNGKLPEITDESTTEQIIASVKARIDDLDMIDESYFGKDRNKIIKVKIEDITNILDKKLVDFGT
jgi:hypothetical protein